MITGKEFKDYILLDAGDKEKIESWNGIILRRPDPMAIWPKTKEDIWDKYVTAKVLDEEKKYRERISKGLELFCRYFEDLWD